MFEAIMTEKFAIPMPSMGLQRVGHDRSDLPVAAAWHVKITDTGSSGNMILDKCPKTLHVGLTFNTTASQR